MKLLRKNVDPKTKEGTITMVPEQAEDMWHAYNLVAVGDSVRSETYRKVQKENANGTSDSERIRITLTLSVEKIYFDTQSCILELKGRNVERDNKYVKTGGYHTLTLSLSRQFTLWKSEWDSVALDRIKNACDPTQYADLAAVVMQEGIAQVCLISANMTTVRSKIEVNVPRKRKHGSEQHKKALERFFDTILQSIYRNVNFEVVKGVLIASPGFVKDQFYAYMMEQAVLNEKTEILDNQNKFLLVHSSSGFKSSLREVLQDKMVLSKLSDTMAGSEIKALEQFQQMLLTNPARAFYGKSHVMKAAEAEAIETLLISDNLFRSSDIEVRKEYVKLVDNIRDSGGEVKIFSSMHISGQQLAQLSGIAAILRFPMPELEDEEGDNHDDDEDEEDDE